MLSAGAICDWIVSLNVKYLMLTYTCALSRSQHLVRACESASLKLLPKKEGDVDSTDDILWRKRVRHGGATAAWYQRQQDSTDDADKYDC